MARATGLYAWGAIPGPRNSRTWSDMQKDDWVLGVFDSTYHYAARVITKFENEMLAEAVWGTDDDGNTFTIEEIIRHRCASLGIPVVSGLMIGHIADKTTVPIGIEAQLDADAGTLTLLEPAVL